MTSSSQARPQRNTSSIYESCLNTSRIIINPSKCVFGTKELNFLSHHIDSSGITPLKEKVQAINDFPLPDSQRKLHQFISLVNFYHRFIPRGAELLQPLHALLTNSKQKSQAIDWHDKALAAFNATKEALASTTLLCYPMPNAPTCLMTDASDMAVGAVLQQYVDGTWHPFSFFSKMKPPETCYSTFDRELVTVYLAIRNFRHFSRRATVPRVN